MPSAIAYEERERERVVIITSTKKIQILSPRTHLWRNSRHTQVPLRARKRDVQLIPTAPASQRSVRQVCADGVKLCLNGRLDAGVNGEVVGLVKVFDVGDLRWGDGGWGVWDEDGGAVVGPERAGEGDADEARG